MINSLKGIAFCEYVDPSVTDIAIQGLNGMELGEKRLRVGRASIGIKQVSGIDMGVDAMSMLAGTTATDSEESSVIQLLNMVTADELMDNDDYEGRCLPYWPTCRGNRILTTNRNLRGCPGGMRQVWQGP
ncbi:hypothetical protein IMZ48_04500 [Candidatus Bathyarchaeota archaeon]|nr:hypothetical protein [Candidatus Bathyarchaeota archaeon]